MLLRKMAMVLGIIGGVYGLMVGLGLFGLVIATFSLYSSPFSKGLVLLLVIAPPIIGTVGAGFVRNKPLLGGSLMATGGIAMILIGVTGLLGPNPLPTSFGLGFVSIPPASFFIVGAVLAVMGRFQN